MPEYSIQKADFEKQKKELKDFAEQPATSTVLDKFSTDGQWSDFWSGGLAGVLSGHKVTGEEINSLVTKLQSCFAEINERDRKVIKEFGQVYETFEALDKGYIQGILIGVKSAEKASQEAKDAQKDINDTIKALQITINKLKEFKGEINQYAHLKDIDDIWCDIQRFEIELESISTKLKTQGANLDKKISTLEQLKTQIEKIRHFNDIDSMWSTIKSQGEEVGSFSRKLEELSNQLNEKINDMLVFKEEIERAKHIKDIDSIWENTKKFEIELESISTKLKTQGANLDKKISTLEQLKARIEKIRHFNDIDSMWSTIKSQGEKVGGFSRKLEELSNQLNENINNLFAFKEEIERAEHIKDIDSIWVNTKNLQEEVSRLSDNLDKRIEKVETEISKIVELAKGQSHFGDIDNIWEGLQEVQKTVGIHSGFISRYEEAQGRIGKELSNVNDFISGIQRIEHFNDIDEEWEFSHGLIKNIEETDNKVLTVEKNMQEYGERLQRAEDENVQLKSKVNMAYIVAGGAIAVSVVQFILQLIGIL